MNSTWTRYGFSKSSMTQAWKSRNAFAAARQSLRKPHIKRSNGTRGRDYLKKISSLIKEKQDASLKLTRKLR